MSTRLISLDVEAAIEDFSNAPDVPRVAHGLSELRVLFRAWVDAFDDFRGEIVEMIEIGDRVACVVDYSGTSPATGLTVAQRAVDVWEFRGGKILRGKIGYTDRDAALQTARASEQKAHSDP